MPIKAVNRDNHVSCVGVVVVGGAAVVGVLLESATVVAAATAAAALFARIAATASVVGDCMLGMLIRSMSDEMGRGLMMTMTKMVSVREYENRRAVVVHAAARVVGMATQAEEVRTFGSRLIFVNRQSNIINGISIDDLGFLPQNTLDVGKIRSDANFWVHTFVESC